MRTWMRLAALGLLVFAVGCGGSTSAVSDSDSDAAASARSEGSSVVDQLLTGEDDGYQGQYCESVAAGIAVHGVSLYNDPATMNAQISEARSAVAESAPTFLVGPTKDAIDHAADRIAANPSAMIPDDPRQQQNPLGLSSEAKLRTMRDQAILALSTGLYCGSLTEDEINSPPQPTASVAEPEIDAYDIPDDLATFGRDLLLAYVADWKAALAEHGNELCQSMVDDPVVASYRVLQTEPALDGGESRVAITMFDENVAKVQIGYDTASGGDSGGSSVQFSFVAERNGDGVWELFC